MTDDKKLNQEELAAVDALSTKVALLLAAAPISDEQRAQLAQLIPQMSFEQLEMTIRSLEESVQDGLPSAENALNVLEGKMKDIKDDYLQKEKDAISAAHSELDDIENIINGTN